MRNIANLFGNSDLYNEKEAVSYGEQVYYDLEEGSSRRWMIFSLSCSNAGKCRMWEDARVVAALLEQALEAETSNTAELKAHEWAFVLQNAREYDRLTQLPKREAVRELRAKQRRS